MLPSRLAARPSCRLLCQSVLSRPLRHSPQQQAFHASSPRRDDIVNLVVAGANLCFNSFHYLGPWGVAIPATAIFVRAAILTPLSMVSIALRARRATLGPLAQATTAVTLRKMQFASARVEPDEVPILHKMVREWAQNHVKKTRSRWHATGWNNFAWASLQFPVYVVFAEGLRKLMGIDDGLLTLLSKGIRNLVSITVTAQGPDRTASATLLGDIPTGNDGVVPAGQGQDGTTATTSLGELPMVNDAVVPTEHIEGSAQDVLSVLARPGNTNVDVSHANMNVDVNPFYDPSFANEGILWFPDLTAADPMHCLPFAISGLMFYNIWRGTQLLKGTSRRKRSPMLVIAAIMGPVLWNVPSGLLLYWVTSNLSSTVANKITEWYYPTTTAPKACKRPLILPPRKVAAQPRLNMR